MADYTQSIDFSAKDALPTGDAGKAAKGADIDTELALIATAIASKIDESREGQASGIATLDADTLVPLAQLPDASLTQQGVVELATGAETITGTDATRAVTPDGLNDLLAQGAGMLLDIAVLTDPAADRLLGWDDSAGGVAQFSLSTGFVITGTTVTVDHDAAVNFVADEHIPHSSITLTAGDGLSGGGTIASDRSFSVDSTVIRTTGNQTLGGTKTFSSIPIGPDGGAIISHGDTSNNSGKITISTGNPSGGSDGDIWFKIS